MQVHNSLFNALKCLVLRTDALQHEKLICNMHVPLGLEVFTRPREAYDSTMHPTPQLSMSTNGKSALRIIIDGWIANRTQLLE